MFAISSVDNRAHRIRSRAHKSNPRTPVGQIERHIAVLHCHLEEAQSLRKAHLGDILFAETKAGTDLLNWKERNTTDIHTWLLRGDSIKSRLNQIGAERRHIQTSFGLDIRLIQEKLIVAMNDLDHLRQ